MIVESEGKRGKKEELNASMVPIWYRIWDVAIIWYCMHLYRQTMFFEFLSCTFFLGIGLDWSHLSFYHKTRKCWKNQGTSLALEYR